MIDNKLNFLLKLNKEEGLNPSKNLINMLDNKEPIEKIKSVLKSKYETMEYNQTEKECDLSFIRMYELLEDRKSIAALVNDIKYIHKFINQDTLENIEYRKNEKRTDFDNLYFKNVSQNEIDSYMNYDFKYNINYFKGLSMPETVDRVFWRIARLYEIQPFESRNLRTTILFALKLIKNIKGETLNFSKINIDELEFEKMMFFACYEDLERRIERQYKDLDKFILMFL